MTENARHDDPAPEYWGAWLLIFHGAVVIICWFAGSLIGRREIGPEVSAYELTMAVMLAIVMLLPVIASVIGYFMGVRRPINISYLLMHAGLIVLGYAAIYSFMPYGGQACGAPGFSRDLYFSMVTFTTLGYGDCAPAGATRLFAAFEALLSYVFVGIVVGIVAGLPQPGSR